MEQKRKCRNRQKYGGCKGSRNNTGRKAKPANAPECDNSTDVKTLLDTTLEEKKQIINVIIKEGEADKPE